MKTRRISTEARIKLQRRRWLTRNGMTMGCARAKHALYLQAAIWATQSGDKAHARNMLAHAQDIRGAGL